MLSVNPFKVIPTIFSKHYSFVFITPCANFIQKPGLHGCRAVRLSLHLPNMPDGSAGRGGVRQVPELLLLKVHQVVVESQHELQACGAA